MNNKTALFCCYRLPYYFLHCIITFAEKYQVNCHVISHPMDKDSPYQLEVHPKVIHYDKSNFDRNSIRALFTELEPMAVYITGWIEREYIYLAKTFQRRKIPILIGLDNHWTNSWKQQIGANAFRWILRRYFTHIWVAGSPQIKFAHKLGFKHSEILTGLYTADTALYRKGYSEGVVHRNILFIGRLISYKRPLALYHFFKKHHENANTKWTLTFIGNGLEKPKMEETDRIKIIDFIQPNQIISYLKKASVLCLPSTREHWGLVVQEACAAGKLLLTSDQVGAATDFLIPDYNGFLFKSDDLNELEYCLKRVLEMTDEELLLFQKRSFELEQKNNPEIWADKLYQIMSSSER